MNEEQKKGKIQVLIMFILILIASLSPFARKILTGNTENFDFSQLGALFIYPLLMIFTYKGNRTAKAILSTFLFFAVVITVVFTNSHLLCCLLINAKAVVTQYNRVLVIKTASLIGYLKV